MKTNTLLFKLLIAIGMLCASALFVSCGDTYDQIYDRGLIAGDSSTVTTPGKATFWFYPNGGDGSTKVYIYELNTSYNLPGALFTRSGYTQTAWNDPIKGNVSLNGSISVTTECDVHLYAVWTVN